MKILFTIFMNIVAINILVINSFANNLDGTYEAGPDNVIVKKINGDTFILQIDSMFGPDQCNFKNINIYVNNGNLKYNPDILDYSVNSTHFSGPKYNIVSDPIILETNDKEFGNDVDKIYVIITEQKSEDGKFDKQILNLNFFGDLKDKCKGISHTEISGLNGLFLKPFIKK